jgi:hypothetical protein
MAGFKIQELRNLEAPNTNPTTIKTKVSEMLQSSSTVRAKVESLNPESGEYRLVLQGTLQQQALKP